MLSMDIIHTIHLLTGPDKKKLLARIKWCDLRAAPILLHTTYPAIVLHPASLFDSPYPTQHHSWENNKNPTRYIIYYATK